MAKAKTGDTVLVHYTGTLNDGSVFDSSEERAPLEFQIGDRNIIPGFQDAVVGMEPGDTKSTSIEPDQAYGEHRSDMVLEFDRAEVPDDMDPEPGHRLELTTSGGQSVPARIVEVDDAKITVDANHPLAGETLTFEIRLMEIRAAT
jgi:peptidylprolyl isomerase/FKBP-type peptidyl-prolyl cis-trans isomerase SlpA